MNQRACPPVHRPPATGNIALAFTLVCLSWGTTYFAIRIGVHTYCWPPALFGGLRVALAGVLLLGYLALRGQPIRVPRDELGITLLSGLILFVGGNGSITFAMDLMPSGLVAVLVATTPLLMALMEMLWPWGDRLTLRGWVGLVAGLGGVCVLLAPRLQEPAGVHGPGLLLVATSAISWSLGSLVLRHRKRQGSHLAAAAYQMAVGGGALCLIGLVFGEGRDISLELLKPGPLATFVYLLIVGSLVGFVAYHWLLGHVPTTLAGTYAYFNPLVAVLVGWLLGGEELTATILSGMAVILVGVALVRGGSVSYMARR
jgi:drug/metabolite transporter (DMT)-like permease